jgi:hypothetical protein
VKDTHLKNVSLSGWGANLIIICSFQAKWLTRSCTGRSRKMKSARPRRPKKRTRRRRLRRPGTGVPDPQCTIHMVDMEITEATEDTVTPHRQTAQEVMEPDQTPKRARFASSRGTIFAIAQPVLPHRQLWGHRQSNYL